MRSLQIILTYMLLLGSVSICAAQSDELVRAAGAKDAAKVAQLLSQGVDVNQRDEKGDTALIVAAREQSMPIVELLLKAKADVNLQNNSGHTALIDAVNMNDIPIVQMLMAHGADPEIKTSRYGRSAHGFAVGSRNQTMRDILSSAGTNAATTSITLDLAGKTLSADQFQQAATRALARRHWKLESQDAQSVVGVLLRKNRLYKAKIEREAGVIVFAYVPGYGMSKTNYLLNLRRDMSFELGIHE